MEHDYQTGLPLSHGDYESSPGGQPPYDEPPGYDTAEPPEVRRGLPWERRDELGPGPAIIQTISQVLFSPSRAFADMKVDGGWGEPLGFAVLVGSVSSWIGQAWIMLLNSSMAGLAGFSAEEVAAENARTIISAFFTPFLICILTVVLAGIAHLLLILFGGAPRPYETTFRVFCYAASVGAVNVVPFCGLFIGIVWTRVVTIIGLRDAHPVPTGRAAAAVLVPLLLWCFCIMVAALLFAGVAGLAMGNL